MAAKGGEPYPRRGIGFVVDCREDKFRGGRKVQNEGEIGEELGR